MCIFPRPAPSYHCSVLLVLVVLVVRFLDDGAAVLAFRPELAGLGLPLVMVMVMIMMRMAQCEKRGRLRNSLGPPVTHYGHGCVFFWHICLPGR